VERNGSGLLFLVDWLLDLRLTVKLEAVSFPELF
jgi:hypothetical protein